MLCITMLSVLKLNIIVLSINMLSITMLSVIMRSVSKLCASFSWVLWFPNKFLRLIEKPTRPQNFLKKFVTNSEGECRSRIEKDQICILFFGYSVSPKPFRLHFLQVFSNPGNIWNVESSIEIYICLEHRDLAPPDWAYFKSKALFTLYKNHVKWGFFKASFFLFFKTH